MMDGRWNSYSALIHTGTRSVFKTEWAEEPTRLHGTVQKPVSPVLWQFKGLISCSLAGWDGCYPSSVLAPSIRASQEAKSTSTPLPSGEQTISIISKRDWSAKKTNCFVWNWERQTTSFIFTLVFWFFFSKRNEWQCQYSLQKDSTILPYSGGDMKNSMLNSCASQSKIQNFVNPSLLSDLLHTCLCSTATSNAQKGQIKQKKNHEHC